MKSTAIAGHTFHGSVTSITVYTTSRWALQDPQHIFSNPLPLQQQECLFILSLVFRFWPSLFLPEGRWGSKFLFFSHYQLTVSFKNFLSKSQVKE